MEIFQLNNPSLCPAYIASMGTDGDDDDDASFLHSVSFGTLLEFRNSV